TGARWWDFGDGAMMSNRPYASHAWAAPGDYMVGLRAFNDDQPGGVSASVTIHIIAQPLHYVAASSLNALPPYASWATAASSIQDAVDAGSVPGAMVLVTNGVYATEGRAVVGVMTNRVAVTKPLFVTSVNSPAVTLIQGSE